MDTLLAYDDNAALIGDLEAKVRGELRPDRLSPEEWRKHLHTQCRQPEHWFKNEDGVSFKRYTGGYWYENGKIFLEEVEAYYPYQTFSVDEIPFSIRAVLIRLLIIGLLLI